MRAHPLRAIPWSAAAVTLVGGASLVALASCGDDSAGGGGGAICAPGAADGVCGALPLVLTFSPPGCASAAP